MTPAPTTEPTATMPASEAPLPAEVDIAAPETASNEQSESARPATTMVEEIGNKNHAEQWFLRHSNGICTVRGSNGETQEVSSYLEACGFFDKNGEN